MRVLGIVCEYNPFHNGHAYQMRKAREESGADAVICVMSGHYTQRGEPAIVDKWTRTRMAIMGGADLVIEMPTFYAMSGAESFAAAGIKLLLAAGADVLSFGCEAEETNVLYDLAALLDQEPAAFRRKLQCVPYEGGQSVCCAGRGNFETARIDSGHRVFEGLTTSGER